MSGYRLLFWTALACAMALPLVAQAEINAMPFAAPANYFRIYALKCQMPGCTSPCCKDNGSQGVIFGCGCPSVSLVWLPSTGANEPFHWSFPNYFTFNTAIPQIITADIFRPPRD